jgi:hypothetical protein
MLMMSPASASEWFCSRLAAKVQAETVAPIVVIASGYGLDYQEARAVLEPRYITPKQDALSNFVTPIYLAEHFTHPHHRLVSVWWHLPSQRWCAFLTMSDVI